MLRRRGRRSHGQAYTICRYIECRRPRVLRHHERDSTPCGDSGDSGRPTSPPERTLGPIGPTEQHPRYSRFPHRMATLYSHIPVNSVPPAASRHGNGDDATSVGRVGARVAVRIRPPGGSGARAPRRLAYLDRPLGAPVGPRRGGSRPDATIDVGEKPRDRFHRVPRPDLGSAAVPPEEAGLG